MSYKSPNIIASEDLGEFDRWPLPEMGDAEKVLPSAEKEQKDRVARSEEIIEEVDLDESLELSPITAEELQAITEAAEREGFTQGEKAGFEQGQKEGHEQGYQAGLDKAEQENQPILERQVSQLLQVAEALIDPISEQQQQLETTVLNYVTSLTKQLVERELLQDSSHILSVVKQAIAALPVGASHTVVCLNPDDLALVETFSAENNKDWKFRGDPQILPGGCRVLTDESLVDFTVESKLQAMFGQFLDRQLTSSSGDVEEVWGGEAPTCDADTDSSESLQSSERAVGDPECDPSAELGHETESLAAELDTPDNSLTDIPQETSLKDTPSDVPISAGDGSREDKEQSLDEEADLSGDTSSAATKRASDLGAGPAQHFADNASEADPNGDRSL